MTHAFFLFACTVILAGISHDQGMGWEGMRFSFIVISIVAFIWLATQFFYKLEELWPKSKDPTPVESATSD